MRFILIFAVLFLTACGPVVLEEPTQASFETFSLDEFGLNPFDFEIQLPEPWSVEAVPEIEALSFVDAEGESQIFLRYFSASEFLTLSTVTIHEELELEVAGRAARRYDIEKKDGVADFPYQPGWRNGRHWVTDIRSSEDSPALFYVFGQNPELSDERFFKILESVDFDALALPLDNFYEGVTLKEFGTYVTPENSPVQPERFSGYHTGVDVEAQGVENRPVYAVADGRVELARVVSGYGGVMILSHEIEGQTYSFLYGHLDAASFAFSVGDRILAGQQIGLLGEGYTPETDGERPHLHLSVRPGVDLTLSGYVSSEAALSAWVDPMSFFSEN